MKMSFQLFRVGGFLGFCWGGGCGVCVFLFVSGFFFMILA